MSSSSDLEIIPAPTTTTRTASPIKPRVSTRVRRAPRGKDELAAPAAPKVAPAPRTTGRTTTKTKPVIPDDEEEEEDEQVSSSLINNNQNRPPTPSVPLDPRPIPSTSKETLPNLPAIPTSFSAPTLGTKPKSLTKPSASPVPPTTTRRASVESSTTRQPPKARSSTPKIPPPARKPYVKPPGGDSSDEADDFFNRAKPIATGGRVPKITKSGAGGGGRVPAAGGGGGGRVPKAIQRSRSSATPAGGTSPPKTNQRKFVPSSSDSDSDSSKSSVPAQATNYSSDAEPMTKSIALPDWAKGSKAARPGMSGADLKKLEKGYKPNRKRRRLSEETDEDDEQKKKKGKGKDGMMDLSEEDEDSSDDSLIPTPKAKAKVQARMNRPKRPGLNISLNDDDDDDDDEEATPEAAPPPQPAKPKTPSPPKKSAAQLLLETARELNVKSPPNESPQRPGTFDSTEIFLGSSSDNDDPNLAALRSQFSRKNNDPDLQFIEPSRKNTLDTGKITVLLKMVFDPGMVPPPEVVLRQYEAENRFEIGVNQSFSDLFDQLAEKRYLQRRDLVITYQKAQLYDFGTPKSLGLKSGDTASMRGYTTRAWESQKLIEKREREKKESDLQRQRESGAGGGNAQSIDIDDDDEDFSVLALPAGSTTRGASLQPPQASSSTLAQQSRSPSAQPHPSAAAATSSSVEKFRLTIRGSKTQSIDLAVKYTTTMSSLIKAYSKQHGITDQTRISKMFIEIEGDKIEGNQTVRDIVDEFGLDDEETVDLRDPGA